MSRRLRYLEADYARRELEEQARAHEASIARALARATSAARARVEGPPGDGPCTCGDCVACEFAAARARRRAA